MKKLKKIVLLIVTFIVAIPYRQLGASRRTCDYGVVNTIPIEETDSLKFNWLGFLQVFAIPIILLIGSFIYKKKQKGKKIKLIVTTIILLLALLYILIFKDLFFNNY